MTLTRFLIMLALFLGLNVYLFIRGWQAIPDRKSLHMIYSVRFRFCCPVYFRCYFCRPVPACLGRALYLNMWVATG